MVGGITPQRLPSGVLLPYLAGMLVQDMVCMAAEADATSARRRAARRAMAAAGGQTSRRDGGMEVRREEGRKKMATYL